MTALVQTVDVDVKIDGAATSLPSILSVVECEVERVFGGGGSKATVKVVFDQLLDSEQIRDIKSGVDQGADDYMFDENSEIGITIDVAVTDHTPGSTEELTQRIYTGTVTKVIENNDRVVTFHALDYRHQLNKNMVRLDIGEEGATTVDIVRNILTGEGSEGDGIGLVEGEDFFVDLGDSKPNRIVNTSWGIEAHDTAFVVLQELAYEEAATIHVDRHNRVHFVKYPEHNIYRPETMPPIVNWKSGTEETDNDVIVESSYDETGLGIYTPTSSSPNREEPEVGGVGEEINQNNVFERQAIEKIRKNELVSNEVLKDSGIIETIGDPRIRPYDSFVLNGDVVNGFSAISKGKYMSKTVRHIISGKNGYVLEIELGQDPEELFEQFTGRASGVVFDEWAEEKEEKQKEDSFLWGILPGT